MYVGEDSVRRSEVSTSVVSNVIRRHTDHMMFAAFKF